MRIERDGNVSTWIFQGIIKEGVPVVAGVGTGETDDERVVLSVVERFCRERKAPLLLHGRDFLVEPTGNGRWDYWAMKRKGCCQLREKIQGLSTALKGKYQMLNTGLALATLEAQARDRGPESSADGGISVP